MRYSIPKTDFERRVVDAVDSFESVEFCGTEYESYGRDGQVNFDFRGGMGYKSDLFEDCSCNPDFPDFHGRENLIKHLEKYFKGYSIDAWEHEKHYFSVSLSPKLSAKHRRLADRVKTLEKKRNETIDGVIKAFVNAKSKTVTCKKCKSKLTRSYIQTGNFRKHVACPLCHEGLLSPTDVKRIERAEQNLKDARQKSKDQLKVEIEGKK